VVSVTVLDLQLAGVTAAASWLAAIFALGVAAYLAVGMIRDIRRGHWGVDILAITAVVSTVAVGEYLAAMIIVLMLAGGEALENYAGGRARRELIAAQVAFLGGMSRAAGGSSSRARPHWSSRPGSARSPSTKRVRSPRAGQPCAQWCLPGQRIRILCWPSPQRRSSIPRTSWRHR
jgi:hypothetical protein